MNINLGLVLLVLSGVIVSGALGRCIRERQLEGAAVLAFFDVWILGTLIT